MRTESAVTYFEEPQIHRQNWYRKAPSENHPKLTCQYLGLPIQIDMTKQAGRVRFGSGQSGCMSSQVDLYFSHEIFFFFFNKENMYLPFGKSCNKLFDIKCFTLNSLLISRMNSVKLINSYSIILKLYKF